MFPLELIRVRRETKRNMLREEGKEGEDQRKGVETRENKKRSRSE